MITFFSRLLLTLALVLTGSAVMAENPKVLMKTSEGR